MIHDNHKKPISHTTRMLLAGLGIISVGLGIIGIVVPVLPTTPFLLLAAYLFVRSSPKLHHWLLTHRIFGKYISSYLIHKAIGRGVKVSSLLLLWSTILLSIYMLRGNIWLQLLLVLIAVGVSIHVLKLKTMPKQEMASQDKATVTKVKKSKEDAA